MRDWRCRLCNLTRTPVATAALSRQVNTPPLAVVALSRPPAPSHCCQENQERTHLQCLIVLSQIYWGLYLSRNHTLRAYCVDVVAFINTLIPILPRMPETPQIHLALADSRQHPPADMPSHDSMTTGPTMSLHSQDSGNTSPVSPVFSARGHLRHASSSSSLTSATSPFEYSEPPTSAKKEGLPLLVEEPQEPEDEFKSYEVCDDVSPCLCTSVHIIFWLTTDLTRRLAVLCSPRSPNQTIGLPLVQFGVRSRLKR